MASSSMNPTYVQCDWYWDEVWQVFAIIQGKGSRKKTMMRSGIIVRI